MDSKANRTHCDLARRVSLNHLEGGSVPAVSPRRR